MVTEFEPAAEMDAIALPSATCENPKFPCAALALQSCGTICPGMTLFDAALQRVVNVWATIPDSAGGVAPLDATTR